MIKYIYREDEVRKVKQFPYKYKGKGIDYKQLTQYYDWCKKNKTEFLNLIITNGSN